MSEQEEQRPKQVPNLEVLAKNMDNLQEYTSLTWFEPSHIAKLQKWIQKNKFTCTEQMQDVNLKVDIFEFTLKKSDKPDNEILKEEIQNLQDMTREVMVEEKLFHYYFCNFWQEKARSNIPGYLVDNIIESPKALFNICEGVGHCELESSRSQKMAYYIGFSQPTPFLYHAGNGRSEE